MERRERFEVLYRSHAGAVRGYALRRTGAAAADDVVAEVFLVAWRRLDDVPADPLPWLLGVGRRVLANRRRGDERQAALREQLVAETVVRPAFEAPSTDHDDRVLRALGTLAPDDREALLLVAWEGLGSARAARVLGLRPGAFAMRLHRARRRLARALAADNPVERTGSQLPEVLR
ncbi:MAG TPA: sigma-70 family RNA polymerase sigma factor [Solirubrobacteraceae bacterium]|jgi:RNA polymerase sigma-70 factor (ECF subfamily)|nr:sigma-70 family RNA polymerase sigma factor [Solirubrobacteraceae bacterium]